MFRILALGLTFSCVATATNNQQYVNCALLSPQEIIESTKFMTANELREMGVRCEDQSGMFVIIADEQTDPYERGRYMRYALRAGAASDQFFEAYRNAVTRR